MYATLLLVFILLIDKKLPDDKHLICICRCNTTLKILEVWLCVQMLQHCRTAFTVKFNCYDQSSRCTKLDDSSVSYAAATAVPIAS